MVLCVCFDFSEVTDDLGGCILCEKMGHNGGTLKFLLDKNFEILPFSKSHTQEFDLSNLPKYYIECSERVMKIFKFKGFSDSCNLSLEFDEEKEVKMEEICKKINTAIAAEKWFEPEYEKLEDKVLKAFIEYFL